jgi:hypothetical protein
MSANVQRPGQSFKRFLASARTRRCRLPVEPHSSSGRIWRLMSPSCWELLPGVEDVPGHLEPVVPERFLRAEAEVGVEGEVATQVRPANLPSFRLCKR